MASWEWLGWYPWGGRPAQGGCVWNFLHSVHNQLILFSFGPKLRNFAFKTKASQSPAVTTPCQVGIPAPPPSQQLRSGILAMWAQKFFIHSFFFPFIFLFSSKLAASFQSMEVRNSNFAAFIDIFTSNTYVMVVMSDPSIRKSEPKETLGQKKTLRKTSKKVKSSSLNRVSLGK